EVKVGELEARRDVATDERVAFWYVDVSGEIRIRRDGRLQRVAGTECPLLVASFRRDDLDRDRVAPIEVPGLVRADAMERRERAIGQQEVDRRRGAAHRPAFGRHALMAAMG